MPPRRLSRYTFTAAQQDPDLDVLMLSEPEPFRFVDRPDTRIHIVQDGDDVFRLAGSYFDGIPRPSGLYWVIMDFQPTPLIDPTVSLEIGRRLYIPSVRMVQEEILSEARRAETTG